MAYTINKNESKPYTYQEYPRRMYKAGETPCSVGTDDARAQKEAEGWSIHHGVTPAAPVDVPVEPPEAAPEPADVPRRGRKARA